MPSFCSRSGPQRQLVCKRIVSKGRGGGLFLVGGERGSDDTGGKVIDAEQTPHDFLYSEAACEQNRHSSDSLLESRSQGKPVGTTRPPLSACGRPFCSTAQLTSEARR